MIFLRIPIPKSTAWGKNNKMIKMRRNKRTGNVEPYIGASPRTIGLKNELVAALEEEYHQLSPMDGPLLCDIHIQFPYLKGEKKSIVNSGVVIYKETYPDRDNIEATIFDALESAGVIANDSRIAAGDFSKTYGPNPCIDIRIEQLNREYSQR